MDPPARDTDADLLERGAHGDDRAFATLVQRHIRPATLLAGQLLGDRDDAEDAVQRAFIAVLERAGTFDASRPFGPWLFGIVRRIAAHERDRQARRRALWCMWGSVTERVAPDAGRQSDARSELDGVQRAAAKLPAMQRACFELVALRGLSVDEVAAMHGLSESTVRQHVFRARRAIAERMDGTNKPGE